MKKFFERHSRILSILVPLIIGGIYIALCCLNMDSAIWYDESYTHYLTRGNYGEIWNMTALDVHPPLYYFAVKTWSLIFGNSIFAMRFMSIFFGLIAILTVFHLIKRHFNLRVSTIATFFFALSPMFIRYGTEMRMYTMILALVMLATVVLTKALEAQSAALELKGSLQKEARRKARKLWLVYAVLICLGMWTQYFAALAWLAHIVYILYYFGAFKKGGLRAFFKNREVLKSLALTYIVAVVLYLPWMPTFIKQFTSVQGGFWIPEVTAETPVNFLTMGLTFNGAETTNGWMLVLVGAVFGLFIYFLSRLFRAASASDKKKLGLWLTLFLAPPFLLILLSIPPFKPTFVDRYVLYSLSALWTLIGLIVALAKQKKTFAYIAFVISIFTLACTGVVNFTTRVQDSTVKDALIPVIALADEGEPVVFVADYHFYDGVAYTSDAHPMLFVEEWSSFQYGAYEPIRNYHFNTYSAFKDFEKDYDKFWVFAGTGSELKDDFKDYQVLYTYEDEHHIAWELEKK